MIKIQNIIPHQYPFLMLDRVVETEQGKWAKGYKNVSMYEWFITEHSQYMPGMLIVEALAQLGAFATINKENSLGFLSSLKGIEFLGNAVPGDRIELVYEVIKSRRGFIMGKGIAYVGEQVIVKAEEIVIFVQSS